MKSETLIKADPLNCLIKTVKNKSQSFSLFNSGVDYTFPFLSWASATWRLAPNCATVASLLSLLSVKDEAVTTAVIKQTSLPVNMRFFFPLREDLGKL